MSTIRKNDPYFSRLYISVFIVVLLLALAVLMALQFAQNQYQRDLRGWQVKLSLIADSRLDAVDNWLEQQFSTVRNVAENPTVRSFMARENASEGAIARDAYLRNMLSVAAMRGHFSPDRQLKVLANQGEISEETGGLALLDMDFSVRMASEGMPVLSGTVANFLAGAKPGRVQMMDITASQDGAVMHMAFLVPVYAEGQQNADAQSGWALGVREVSRELFSLLQHPGIIEASLENILVREENGGVTYLSPLADGTPAMRKHLSLPSDTSSVDSLASAFAVDDAGSFATRTDYRLKEVLVTGRKVPGTNWVLVSKVDKDEAMANARAERRSIVMQLLLAVAVVFVALVAAWRHGTSRDATRMAKKLESTLRKAEARGQMLDVVTNTQPGAVFILDEDNNCRYGNSTFAEDLGVKRASLKNKALENLVGAALAREYARASEAALRDEKTIIWTRRVAAHEGKDERVFRVKHIPLNQLPVEDAPLGARGVLVVEQDITALVVERERRVRNLRGLIDTLVSMVDRRDPYAANHSKTVAAISRKVAEQMDVEPQLVETAETAGMLMNIGKMVVPTEWLTKSGALNDKERAAIRDSLLESATMLEGVEFDGPVAETLRQTLENWDGSGPQKLKGDEILVTARIVAVANAFVGMVSPRSYRKAMSVDKALDVLMKSIEKEFDRKVVIALANYIDNHGGRAMIAALAQEPTEE